MVVLMLAAGGIYLLPKNVLGLTAQFCLTKDGQASLRCLMMAALVTVLVFSIAPAAIFMV